MQVCKCSTVQLFCFLQICEQIAVTTMLMNMAESLELNLPRILSTILVSNPMLKYVLHFCHNCTEDSQCSIRYLISSPVFLYRQHMLGSDQPMVWRLGHVSNGTLIDQPHEYFGLCWVFGIPNEFNMFRSEPTVDDLSIKWSYRVQVFAIPSPFWDVLLLVRHYQSF